MAYGPDLTDLFRRAGTYIDRILKGDKVGELPIEADPLEFRLAVDVPPQPATTSTRTQNARRIDRFMENAPFCSGFVTLPGARPV